MPRTANDVGMAQDEGRWPPDGTVRATCVGVQKWVSKPPKSIQAIILAFETPDGHYSFSDKVFVTIRALARMNLVAQRLCGMPKETVLPDDDREAGALMAKYILEHAMGKEAILTIQTKPETFMPSTGPRMGQTVTVQKKSVAFGGYATVDSISSPTRQGAVSPLPSPEAADETIPF